MQGWNQAAESNGHAQISPDTYKQASVRAEDRSLKGISLLDEPDDWEMLRKHEKSQDKILQRCSLGIPDRNSLLILQSIHAFADAPSPRSPRSVRRACRFREWRKIRALLRKLTHMQMYVHDRKHRIYVQWQKITRGQFLHFFVLSNITFKILRILISCHW